MNYINVFETVAINELECVLLLREVCKDFTFPNMNYLSMCTFGDKFVEEFVYSKKSFVVKQIKKYGKVLHIALSDVDLMEKIQKTKIIFNNIYFLNLSETYFSDVSLVGNVVKLFLDGTSVDNINNLDCKNITELDLSNTEVKDISVLARTNIKSLNLKYTRVSDFSALDGMHMDYLDLSYTNVKDVHPFRNVETLVLYDCPRIRNVDALTHNDSASAIRYLNLSETRVRSIALPDTIRELDLGFSKVHDISKLAICTNLRYLNLSHTRIKDFSNLKYNKSIRTLELSRTGIKNLSVLEDMHDMKNLHLSYNMISDISVISSFTNIHTLDLSRTPVEDISVLSHIDTICYLDLSYTRIRDISMLYNMVNANKTPINTLDLSYNKISDVSVFNKNSRRIKYLSLNGTLVKYVDILAHSNIHDLHLNYTKVKDVSMLGNIAHISCVKIKKVAS